MPFYRNVVYIINEKTFLKITSVLFRLFTNLLETVQRRFIYIYTYMCVCYMAISTPMRG